jgi:hypothetical protein
MFVPGNPFQPILIIASKAGAPLWCSTSGRSHEHNYIRVKRLARFKHSSLLSQLINCGRKNFLKGPGLDAIKLFSSPLLANKLECLALTCFISLV